MILKACFSPKHIVFLYACSVYEITAALPILKFNRKTWPHKVFLSRNILKCFLVSHNNVTFSFLMGNSFSFSDLISGWRLLCGIVWEAWLLFSFSEMCHRGEDVVAPGYVFVCGFALRSQWAVLRSRTVWLEGPWEAPSPLPLCFFTQSHSRQGIN